MLIVRKIVYVNDIIDTRQKIILNTSLDELSFSHTTPLSGGQEETRKILLKITDLRRRPEYSSGVSWILIPVFNDAGEPSFNFLNIAARTYSEKLEAKLWWQMEKRRNYLTMFVPFENCSFEEMSYIIFTSKGSEVESNKTFTASEETPRQILRPVRADFRIDGPDTLTPDSSAEYIITATQAKEPTNRPIEVVLENRAGYLSKNHFILRGQEKFKVYSLGLEPGDVLQVRAGFRFWSSITMKEIKIV